MSTYQKIIRRLIRNIDFVVDDIIELSRTKLEDNAITVRINKSVFVSADQTIQTSRFSKVATDVLVSTSCSEQLV